MFIRRKPNKRGTFSIQVADKINGRYTLIKSFGASKVEDDETAREDVLRSPGLLSRKNIMLLKQAGYKFIPEGSIKKESKPVQDWVLDYLRLGQS